MAKGARASTRKANNQRLKKKVFGPVETARVQRLSEKLLELAAQPKPRQSEVDADMKDPHSQGLDGANRGEAAGEPAAQNGEQLGSAMDLDRTAKPSQGGKDGSSRVRKIEKRRTKKPSIVFPSMRKKKRQPSKGSRISK